MKKEYTDINGHKIEKLEHFGPWRKPRAKWMTTVFDNKGEVLCTWQFATLKEAREQRNIIE